MTTGISWLGGASLPSHWRSGPVKRFGIVTLGKMLQPNGGGEQVLAPYLRAANIQPDGVLRVDEFKSMWFDPDELRGLSLNRGDVVVVEGGIGGYGRAAYVLDDTLSGWGFQNSINRVRPIGDNGGRYLAYVLLAVRALGYFSVYCNVVSMPHLTAEKLAALPIPLPPPGEQRRIADFLDRETAQIDALVAKQEQLIAGLRERRAAVLASAFDELPYSTTQLRYVADIQTGVTLSGSGNVEQPEWPYLRVANVQTGYVDLSRVTMLRLDPVAARASMLRRGDVLMTEGGDIDKLGRGAVWRGEIEPMLHQNHVFAVRPGSRLDSEFLVLWLDAPVARQYFYTTAKKTTNLASTNKTLVGRLPITLPPVETQREFVARIMADMSKIDALMAKANEFIALARERRAALVTEAVTGRIDVSTGKVREGV